MRKIKKISPVSIVQLLSHSASMFRHHHHDWGLLALFCALTVLSLLCAVQPGRQAKVVYPAGEIAAVDVVADRDMMVEDPKATQLRRDRSLALQPTVFDLDKKSIESFHRESLGLLDSINRQGLEDAGVEAVRRAFNEKHGSDISLAEFRVLSSAPVQDYMLKTLIPWMESALSSGVIADIRQLANSDYAAVIRDLDSGTEVLHTQADGLSDLRLFRVALGRKLRDEGSLTTRAKSVLQEIMPLMVVPSLAVNQEVTNQRNEEMLSAVEPVFYKVQTGEVIVRAGDMVTHEQQIKLQALFRAAPGAVDWQSFGGCFILGFFLLLGLFITPGGNKGTVLKTRDQLLIAMLLVLFGIAAWGVMSLAAALSAQASARILAFAFPVAGGAGLAAQIFAARRYCTVGLALSFFCAVIFHGDVSLFFFYFMSSMTNTWIVMRAQSRQDVVWGSVPLFFWMVLTGMGAYFFMHLNPGQLPMLLLAFFCSAVSSLFLIFALSPVLEVLMGYTTRFRMMELMNLEHPLLRELMVKVPGTYHHSIVVSNLVEAGAMAIGANSLLCKVGALYHDIGKIFHPRFFIENQFGGRNPHDRISPIMSAKILFAHVKDGVSLAKEYRLGQEITDIIQQHHGNRAAMSFYGKAKQEGGEPNLEDFCYPGPRPQTREAALVMLADSVEAPSRTLADPTPSVIREHINKIMKGVYSDGQLDNSELTFHDLSKIAEAFAGIITGLHHQRIAYPGQEKNIFPGQGEAEDLKEEWVVSRPAGAEKAPAGEAKPGQADTGEAAGQKAAETPPAEGR